MRDGETFLMLHPSYDPAPAFDFVRRLAIVAPRAAQEVTAHTS